MTTDEARAALLSRPRYWQTPLAIRSHLYYEQQPKEAGETYSPCMCGRGMSKAYRCVECLREMLEVAEGEQS